MAKILFIDDDPITLELMGSAAKLLGHQAVLAHSGKQAIEIAISDQPKMIFLDMMMPDQDGLTVLKELKQLPVTSSIPVIILSAGTSENDSIEAEMAGASGYLSKPIPLQTLMETIHKYTPS
jgi:CheY-like chemotaxis protein